MTNDVHTDPRRSRHAELVLVDTAVRPAARTTRTRAETQLYDQEADRTPAARTTNQPGRARRSQRPRTRAEQIRAARANIADLAAMLATTTVPSMRSTEPGTFTAATMTDLTRHGARRLEAATKHLARLERAALADRIRRDNRRETRR